MKSKTKDEYIAFRLSEDLKELIQKQAEEKEANISCYIRKVLKEKLNA